MTTISTKGDRYQIYTRAKELVEGGLMSQMDNLPTGICGAIARATAELGKGELLPISQNLHEFVELQQHKPERFTDDYSGYWFPRTDKGNQIIITVLEDCINLATEL